MVLVEARTSQPLKAISMVEEATQILLASQNADGGWSAIPGRSSNTESTALAVLALRSTNDTRQGREIRAGLTWLIQHQHQNGSFRLNDATPAGSWTTGLAILCLSAFSEFRENALQAANWVINHEARTLGWFSSFLVSIAPDPESVKLNPDLNGWPWVPETFSWVEPTSYYLIALKRLRGELPAKAEGRIREAEMMMFDRMCSGGGWNYGNSRVYGEELWPYPDTTAVALISLQDHPNTADTGRSVEVLKQDLLHVNSGWALSWSVICFGLYGQRTAAWRRRLIDRFETNHFLGETRTTALAILALGEGVDFFRFP